MEDSGIPEEYFLRKKRLQQFQDMLEQFKKKQEERKFEIVEKLIKEEKMNKQMKKTVSQEQSYHSKSTGVRRKRIRESLAAPTGASGETSTDISTDAHTDTDPNTNIDANTDTNTEGMANEEEGPESPGEQHSPSESTSDTEEPINGGGVGKTSVVEPEIRGLWEPLGRHKGVWSPGKHAGGSGDGEEGAGEGSGGDGQEKALKREASKAEVQMMKKAMDKLRKSKITKQIAAGKEFKVSLHVQRCIVRILVIS